jgi:dihydropteroate synthase
MPASFLVAGIVNITPDSFSDGGQCAEPAAALDRVRRHVREGAHIVDLGAESTRPGASGIGHDKEWRRLEPVLREIARLRESPAAESSVSSFVVSVDTFRAATARTACAVGADIINDISGTAFEPAMAEVLAEYKPGYVLGHCPAPPATMQQSLCRHNVVEVLLRHFTERMNLLAKSGLPEDRICLDPCIGFGKSAEDAAAVFRGIPRLLELGRPLYFGVSRKSFLGVACGVDLRERGALTQAAVALLAEHGVAVHRVHEVAATRATLRLVEWLRQV